MHKDEQPNIFGSLENLSMVVDSICCIILFCNLTFWQESFFFFFLKFLCVIIFGDNSIGIYLAQMVPWIFSANL